jgi:hypothetical protein
MAEGLPPRVIPKPLPVLKGFKVHFAEGHLYPPALDILKGYVSVRHPFPVYRISMRLM